MTIIEKTIVYDHITGGTVTAQDVTADVVHEDSLWNNTTRPNPVQSLCVLTMERTGAGNPLIREGFRIINGLWDTDTSTWTKARFGGYIAKSRRTQQANMLRFTLTLADYGLYLTKRRILAWPTGPDPPYSGFPAGATVKRWLIGDAGADGIPYPGLLTAHYTGMRTDGLDGFLEFITLDEDTMPGTLGTYYGMYGFTTMDVALADIMAASVVAYKLHYSGPAWLPGLWVEAALAPGGTDIVPRVRIGNMADVAVTPVGLAVGIDEPGGPYPAEALIIEQPYAEEREMCEANNVTFLGEGGDPTLAGNPLVWGEANTPDHDLRYLAEFSTEGRWDAVEHLTQVYTLATAVELAQTVEAESGAGSGSYEFNGAAHFPAGDWLTLIKSDIAVNGDFPIRGVQMARRGHSTTPTYQYRLGFNVRPSREILGSGAVQTRLNMEELAFKLGRLKAVPGTPTPTNVDRHPLHSAQNTHQARANNVTLVRYRASPNPPPSTDPAAHGRASLVEFFDRTGQRAMHAGPDGEPRGHSLLIAESIWSAPLVLNMSQRKTFVRAVESGAAGHWTYRVNGVAVGLPFTVRDTDRLTLTPPSLTVACGLTLTELWSPPSGGL